MSGTEPEAPLDLDRLEELCAGATAGPWEGEPQALLVVGATRDAWVAKCDREEDAAFIAAARAALPALIKRVRRTETALRRLQEAAALAISIHGLPDGEVADFLAAIHREAAVGLQADAEPVNERADAQARRAAP